MSLLSKDSLIPLTSLLAGILVTSLFFAWYQQPSAEVQAAIARFNELPESQQSNVRNIAAEYLKDLGYQQRIQAIHLAVEKDPTLLDKLHKVDSLLKSQDRPTRARLQSTDGNWLQQVEELHRRQTTTGLMVKLGRPFNFGGEETIDLMAESQVGEFLDAIIGQPVPELATKLAGLDSPDHEDEQILTKLIWLARQLQPDVESNIAPATVVTNGKAYVVNPDVIAKMEEQIRRWRPDSRGDDQFVNRILSSILMRPLLKHYKDRFNQVHVPANSDAVEIFEDEIDRRRQLELMQMDPIDARSQLNSEIIRHMKVTDPAIEALNQDLKELDSQIPRSFDMNRGRGGSGGSRSGFPNRPPRPDQGGGRNGNERDNRPPPRERPPGEERGGRPAPPQN